MPFIAETHGDLRWDFNDSGCEEESAATLVQNDVQRRELIEAPASTPSTSVPSGERWGLWFREPASKSCTSGMHPAFTRHGVECWQPVLAQTPRHVLHPHVGQPA